MADDTPSGRALQTAIMGAWDSVYRRSFQLAPYNPDELTSQKGFDTYRQMLTTSACRAPLNVKRYTVLQKPWKVEPCVIDPTDTRHEAAKALADHCNWVLGNILDTDTGQPQDLRTALFELLLACWQGFALAEIIWRPLTEGPYSGKLGLKYLAAKPAKQIGFDLDTDTLAVREIRPYTPTGGYGKPVSPTKVVLFTYNPYSGLPYGDGDGRAAYKHWWQLDALQKFWSMALERFGSAFILAKYPAGNATALQEVLTALDRIRQGSPAVLPREADAELMQVAASAFEGFRDAADWHTQAIAQNVLGNTLTTGEGKRVGSMALGKVHQETQDVGLGYLRSDLESVINIQLIRRIVLYNFGPAALALCPRFSLGNWDSKDLLSLSKAFTLLTEGRMVARRAKWVREEMGLPPMDPDEEQMLDEEEEQERQLQQQAADARATAPGASRGPRPADPTDDDTDNEEDDAQD
jgi:Protein of unknown function (DUF935)